MNRDLTEAEVLAIAAEMRAALAPIVARHRLKYVITGAAQNNSDPATGKHFLVASEIDDPMWSVIALMRSAQALTPAADAQNARMRKGAS